MEVFNTRERIHEHMTAIHSAITALCAELMTQDTAFYQPSDKDSPLQGKRAVEAICSHIRQLDYSPNHYEHRQRGLPVIGYGAMAIPSPAFDLVDRVNEAKSQFKSFHEHHVETAKDKELAQQEIREALRTILDNANIDAIDRGLPVFRQPALGARWFRNQSIYSNRRTIRDLIAELEERIQKDDEDTGTYHQLLANYRQMDHETPLSFRNRRSIVRTNCTLTLLDEQGQRSSKTCYGANPVFYANEPEFNPVFQGLTPLSGREASHRKVKTHPIHPMLPSWYEYENPDVETSSNQSVPKTSRRKNPFSKTPFEGLWLGVKGRKTGPQAFVQVGISDVSTSFSISRHGLRPAWQRAAEIYCENTRYQLSDVLSLMPDADQVQNLLDWHISHSKKSNKS